MVTVANVGDSRVVLGYRKEIYPTSGSLHPRTSGGTSRDDVSCLTFDVLEELEASDNSEGGEEKVESSMRVVSPVDEGYQRNERHEAGDVAVLGGVEERTFGPPCHVQLTTDHKPDVKEERERIFRAGKFLSRANNSH